MIRFVTGGLLLMFAAIAIASTSDDIPTWIVGLVVLAGAALILWVIQKIEEDW